MALTRPLWLLAGTLAAGGGVANGDADGDGLTDVCLSRLFGGGRFPERAADAGLALTGSSVIMAWSHHDGDGDLESNS